MRSRGARRFRHGKRRRRRLRHLQLERGAQDVLLLEGMHPVATDGGRTEEHQRGIDSKGKERKQFHESVRSAGAWGGVKFTRPSGHRTCATEIIENKDAANSNMVSKCSDELDARQTTGVIANRLSFVKRRPKRAISPHPGLRPESASLNCPRPGLGPEALEVPALPGSWKEYFRERLGRVREFP